MDAKNWAHRPTNSTSTNSSRPARSPRTLSGRHWPRLAADLPTPGAPDGQPPEIQRRYVVTLDRTIREILSLPREAGTPEAELARKLVTRYLTDLGYKVEVQKFSFTPASLRAFPVFGAG